jgi:transcriptional regulator
MYVPSAFAENHPDELLAIMRSCSLPILVSQAKDREGIRLVATHLPLTVEGNRIVGHVARANTQWKLLDTTAEALAIFSGVDGYVSPSHYATKRESGKVVPTWNYEAVHAYGRLEVIEDAAQILAIVSNFTDRQEASRDTPWKVTDAPADYIATLLKSIVGVVLHTTRVIGVRKLSQNKTAADRDGVIAGELRENPMLGARMLHESA